MPKRGLAPPARETTINGYFEPKVRCVASVKQTKENARIV